MPNVAYLQYKEKGFWIPESFIEVLSQFICEAFESIGLNSFSDNLQRLYRSCDYNRNGSSLGMVNIPLNRSIINADDRDIFLGVLNHTKTILLYKGNELTISYLNEFERSKIDEYFQIEWNFPIKTQSLIATIEIIEQMLNGTWQSSNYGVYYEGFNNSLNMPEI